MLFQQLMQLYCGQAASLQIELQGLWLAEPRRGSHGFLQIVCADACIASVPIYALVWACACASDAWAAVAGTTAVVESAHETTAVIAVIAKDEQRKGLG